MLNTQTFRLSDPALVVVRNLLMINGLLFSLFAWSDSGVVTHLSGVLTVQKSNGDVRILGSKSEVNEGDTLISEDKTFARIKFSDGGNLVIRPNSRVRIDAYSYKPAEPREDKVAVDLIKGGLRMITGVVGKRSRENVQTTTATSTIGIRGTHFGLLLCQDDCTGTSAQNGSALANGLYMDVLEGVISATNPAGTVDISAGQFGFVRSAQDQPIQIPAEEGVRVSVPPSMVASNGEGLTLGRNSNDAQCAVK